MKQIYRNNSNGKVDIDRSIDNDMYLLQSALLKQQRSEDRLIIGMCVCFVIVLSILLWVTR